MGSPSKVKVTVPDLFSAGERLSGSLCGIGRSRFFSLQSPCSPRLRRGVSLRFEIRARIASSGEPASAAIAVVPPFVLWPFHVGALVEVAPPGFRGGVIRRLADLPAETKLVDGSRAAGGAVEEEGQD
jgi:hypothetical protein